ncbi:MAG TPA: type II toxin-antitoxin system prevent-host-death family antitoxin [Patescibacteria group bacterium]|jgi:prevent-host-death family protein|nr:type II toxin-antitoxin system prevent-host-death family antitoxin [Patescibacteria group bacterium]
MSIVVNVHDFKTNYSKYLEQAISGQEILLGKHGKAVAKIIPLTPTKKSRVPGALKGKIWVSDDFDEPMLELWTTIGSKK